MVSKNKQRGWRYGRQAIWAQLLSVMLGEPMQPAVGWHWMVDCKVAAFSLKSSRRKQKEKQQASNNVQPQQGVHRRQFCFLRASSWLQRTTEGRLRISIHSCIFISRRSSLIHVCDSPSILAKSEIDFSKEQVVSTMPIMETIDCNSSSAFQELSVPYP